jgi:hypothetical protein
MESNPSSISDVTSSRGSNVAVDVADFGGAYIVGGGGEGV